MLKTENSNIIVSICCITYNHAQFIRKALDGFLMQEPPTGVSKDDAWYEILIHDDASTDGTDDIIREYAAKYPGKIFPLYEEVNQYSQGKENVIDMYNYGRAKGKYIAYCEGDDYWTDPLKLRKQVDFMEKHPDYSVCFHCYRSYSVKNDVFRENTQPVQLLKQCNAVDGMDIDMNTYFSGWFAQPLTMLFRVSMYNFKVRDKYKYFRDMHEIYYLIEAGKCRLMNFDGGVHVVHEGGVASMINYDKYCAISLPIDREFYWKTRNTWSKENYIRNLDVAIRNYKYYDKKKAFRYALIRLVVSKHLHAFAEHMKWILKK